MVVPGRARRSAVMCFPGLECVLLAGAGLLRGYPSDGGLGVGEDCDSRRRRRWLNCESVSRLDRAQMKSITLWFLLARDLDPLH